MCVCVCTCYVQNKQAWDKEKRRCREHWSENEQFLYAIFAWIQKKTFSFFFQSISHVFTYFRLYIHSFIFFLSHKWCACISFLFLFVFLFLLSKQILHSFEKKNQTNKYVTIQCQTHTQIKFSIWWYCHSPVNKLARSIDSLFR